MPDASFIISLPIADRRTSFAFYCDCLDLAPVGEPADDGIPEPLQFELSESVRIMLIPTGGFGWVIGHQTPAPGGTSECLMSMTAGTDAAVNKLIRRAGEGGASIITEPGPQPWGYAGSFADPDGHLWMITSTEAAG